jgi:hypothetical protein
MLRENSPDWTATDTRRATAYVHELIDTINTFDPDKIDKIRSRMQELKREDVVFCAVVYSMLPRPVRLMLYETE